LLGRLKVNTGLAFSRFTTTNEEAYYDKKGNNYDNRRIYLFCYYDKKGDTPIITTKKEITILLSVKNIKK